MEKCPFCKTETEMGVVSDGEHAEETEVNHLAGCPKHEDYDPEG